VGDHGGIPGVVLLKQFLVYERFYHITLVGLAVIALLLCLFYLSVPWWAIVFAYARYFVGGLSSLCTQEYVVALIEKVF
jgi:hypothetical protein